MASRPAPISPAADYCRRARRLRGSLSSDPVRLHAALQRLNADVHPASGEPDPESQFANLVIERLEAQVLRYSRRIALLREADRLGIGRFRANLIIAQVQYRRQAPDEAAPDASRGVVARGFSNVLAFLSIEALLAASVWLLLM